MSMTRLHFDASFLLAIDLIWYPGKLDFISLTFHSQRDAAPA